MQVQGPSLPNRAVLLPADHQVRFYRIVRTRSCFKVQWWIKLAMKQSSPLSRRQISPSFRARTTQLSLLASWVFLRWAVCVRAARSPLQPRYKFHWWLRNLFAFLSYAYVSRLFLLTCFCNFSFQCEYNHETWNLGEYDLEFPNKIQDSQLNLNFR